MKEYSKDLPIGFIDSGFGGLTVVRQSLKQLPNESIIYVGDNARAPYGTRPLSEVKKYIWELTNFLLNKGIKMLVIACNTGTAAALEDIREQLPIPVVGVIHAGSRAAIKETKINRVGVLGTEGTINSHLYENIIKEKANQIDVYSLAAPEFVSIVEEQRTEDPQIFNQIEKRVTPLLQEKVDTIILGCTHYPILRDKIQEVAGSSVNLIDSGIETINEVSTLLDYFNISRTSDDNQRFKSTATYYTTGSTNEFEKFARVWLDDSTIHVLQAKLKEAE